MPSSRSARPHLAPMHLSFLFSGAGTLLLGPVLPEFALRWHLRDSQSGLLIAAQFFGLFLGAIAIARNLRLTLLCGYLTAATGFLLLAAAVNRTDGDHLGIFALFLLGLGLGQITTTVNLFSALRFDGPNQRSSALALLTFTWSAGAVLSPLLAGFYLRHAGLSPLLLTFAAVAIVLFATVALAVPNMARRSAQAVQAVSMPAWPLTGFFLLFFLYGGLEATLSGWLSTYSLRYAGLSLVDSAYCATALWSAFAVGRALAAALLRMLPERSVRGAGVLVALLASIALRGAHTGLSVGVCAAFIGLGIAPFFAVTFSLLIEGGPSPRQAGAATSNIGLGSAVFPYITGIVSTQAGSLHAAMLTPVAIAVCLLGLCYAQPASRDEV